MIDPPVREAMMTHARVKKRLFSVVSVEGSQLEALQDKIAAVVISSNIKTACSHLTKDEIIIILSTQFLVDLAYKKSVVLFMYFALYDAGTITLVENTPYLKKLLNQANSDPDTTHFYRGCVPRALINLQRSFHMLEEKEINAFTELEIYKQVWESPGGLADIKKMLSYLFAMGFDVSVIRVESILTKVVNNNVLVKSISEHFFENQMKDIPIEKMDFMLPGENRFLLVHFEKWMENLHIIFANRTHENKFIVFDPVKSVLRYESLHEFVAQDSTFLGVLFQVNQRANKDSEPVLRILSLDRLLDERAVKQPETELKYSC
jgi:hypothetical protein